MSEQNATAEAPAAEAPETFDAHYDSLGHDEAPSGSFEDALNEGAEGDEAEAPAEAGEAGEGAQPRGPDGKFAAKGTGAAETTAAAGQEARSAEGDTTPEGFVRIALPGDHPLREQGHEYVLAPVGQEDLYKSLANAPVRRREVEALRQETMRLQQAAAEAQAAARAQAEFNALVFQDPRVIDTYRAVAEEHGEEAAQTWLDGLLAKQGDQRQQHVQQALQQVQEAAWQQTATEFAQGAIQTAAVDFPGWTEGDVRGALGAYGAYMEQFGINELDPGAFRDFATAIYLNSATGRARVAAWTQQQEQAAAQAAAEQQAATAAAQAKAERERRAVEENPLGALPAAAHTGHRVPAGGGQATSFDDYYRSLDQ